MNNFLIKFALPDPDPNPPPVANDFLPLDLKNKALLGDNSIVANLLSTSLAVAAVAAVGFIIVSGYMYVTSGGDQAKVDKAKKGIVYALIGFAVIMLAYAILFTVKFLLDSLNPTPPATP